MLVQFSVENFRSIKEEQTLSMVKSSAYKELKENTFTPKALNTPDLLKTAVIYGANASGKSNLLKALFVMQNSISESFSKHMDEKIPVIPFIFDPQTRLEPTTFQISLIVQLTEEITSLVEYGFSADKHRVYEEWLSVFPKGREQAWFHRSFDDETQLYHWDKESSYFKGQKENWKNSTRPDQLFLSTAVHLNSTQLKPIYDALFYNIGIISKDRIGYRDTQKFCEEELTKALLVSFLQQADINLIDIELEKPKNEFKQLNKFLEILPDTLRNNEAKAEVLGRMEIYFVHLDKNGQRIKVNLDDESDGTQKLFEFSAHVFHTLGEGATLVIDEFNKSLHPDLVHYLVKMFNSDLNDTGGQLIFTTHETSVLRKELLRRDQIWFCEKDTDNKTTLYPLSDFSPLQREDLEESYLHGRYGGKPLIKSFMFPDEVIESLNKDG